MLCVGFLYLVQCTMIFGGCIFDSSIRQKVLETSPRTIADTVYLQIVHLTGID